MENRNLHLAKFAKNDEFYTQLTDISDELKYYRESFEGKVVLCNCDDSEESEFTRYFILNFHALKLKKLICTFFDSTLRNSAFAFVYNGEDLNGDGRISQADIDMIRQNKAFRNLMVDDSGFDRNNPTESNKKGLYGSGDFRSANAKMYLEMADIVVTNPPFSLFREYVSQLMEYDKKFLIIGNMNAITYKEIFPYIMENKLWFGYGFNKPMTFEVPENYHHEIVDGKRIAKVPAITWFTNLPNQKRTEPMELWKEYKPEVYPKYNNYDAINVDKTYMIPKDYDGVMGVPISFLNKYCPTQFEIIGLGIANLGLACGVQPYKPEHREYRKNIQKRGVVDGDLYMIENGIVKVPYARILIRRK